MNTTITTDTIHSGRFASRPVDSTTLRVGVKGSRSFREVYYMDQEMAMPLKCVCFVEMDSSKPYAENMKLLQGVVDLLAAGQQALKEKRELEGVAA